MKTLPKIIKRQKDGSYTVHDQVIFFESGHKRTIKGVKYVWENSLTHLVTENKLEFIINMDKVEFIQRYLDFKNADL